VCILPKSELFFRSVHLRVALINCESVFCNNYGGNDRKNRAGVNFINVIRKNFLYECHFGSFFSSYVYIENAAETTFVQKICTYNVDEIDSRGLKHGLKDRSCGLHWKSKKKIMLEFLVTNFSNFWSIVLSNKCIRTAIKPCV